jgi:PDZ domain-containing protein
MVDSQDSSVAAALTELGYDLTTHAEVTGVSPDGPADGLLQPRDRIESINGGPIRSVEDVFAVMGLVAAGDTIEVRVERDSASKLVRVKTVPAPDDPKRALLGVFVGTGYDFPFDVTIGIDEAIGGPSAGLVFSLAVYDALTPGPLTGGRVIAGTGSITAEGEVGPIGGIQQKIAGAEDSGATLFLVPPDNCDAALGASVDDIELVRADTLHSAVRSLQAYAENPDADLPRCPDE